MSDEGRKDDSDKLRVDLVPIAALEDVIKVLNYGAKKYGDRNWEKGINYSRVFAATCRHIFSWWRGEERDKESNLSHLAHAACNMLFLLHYTKHPSYEQFNDRPNYYRIGKCTSQE